MKLLFLLGLLLIATISIHTNSPQDIEQNESFLPQGYVVLYNLTNKELWYSLFSHIDGTINNNNWRLENIRYISQTGVSNPQAAHTICGLIINVQSENTNKKISVLGREILLHIRELQETNAWNAKPEEKLLKYHWPIEYKKMD